MEETNGTITAQLPQQGITTESEIGRRTIITRLPTRKEELKKEIVMGDTEPKRGIEKPTADIMNMLQALMQEVKTFKEDYTEKLQDMKNEVTTKIEETIKKEVEVINNKIVEFTKRQDEETEKLRTDMKRIKTSNDYLEVEIIQTKTEINTKSLTQEDGVKNLECVQTQSQRELNNKISKEELQTITNTNTTTHHCQLKSAVVYQTITNNKENNYTFSGIQGIIPSEWLPKISGDYKKFGHRNLVIEFSGSHMEQGSIEVKHRGVMEIMTFNGFENCEANYLGNVINEREYKEIINNVNDKLKERWKEVYGNRKSHKRFKIGKLGERFTRDGWLLCRHTQTQEHEGVMSLLYIDTFLFVLNTQSVGTMKNKIF